MAKTKPATASRPSLSVASALRELTTNPGDARLSAEMALLLLAYLTVRDEKFPEDLVAFTQELKSGKPFVWVSLLQRNYMRMEAALKMSRMPVVKAAELQKACLELAAEARVA